MSETILNKESISPWMVDEINSPGIAYRNPKIIRWERCENKNIGLSGSLPSIALNSSPCHKCASKTTRTIGTQTYFNETINVKESRESLNLNHVSHSRERRSSFNSDFLLMGRELRHIADDLKKQPSTSLESSTTDLTRCAIVNNFLQANATGTLRPRSLSAASSFTDLYKAFRAKPN